MTLFRQIANRYTCPVEKIKSGKAIGHYYPKYTYGYQSKIQIYSIGNDAEDIMSLLHEQVHFRHDRDGCKCMKLSNHTLAEYHAFKEGLQDALQLDNKDVIKKMVELIQSEANVNCQNSHRTAAKKVMKLKLWNKAKKRILRKNDKKT